MNRNRIARRMVRGRRLLGFGLVLVLAALEFWMACHCCSDLTATSAKSKIPGSLTESVAAPDLVFVIR